MVPQLNDEVFEQFPVLQTKRLVLRSIEEEDLSFLFALRSHAQIITYLDRHPDKDISDSKKNLEQIQTQYKEKNGIAWVMCLKEDERPIGICSIWRIERNCARGEIGYSLFPEFWGKGYATEAVGFMANFAFRQMELHSLMANINPKNNASRKILEKLCFQQEAYFRENWYFEGTYIDSAIYCRLHSDICESD